MRAPPERRTTLPPRFICHSDPDLVRRVLEAREQAARVVPDWTKKGH